MIAQKLKVGIIYTGQSADFLAKEIASIKDNNPLVTFITINIIARGASGGRM